MIDLAPSRPPLRRTLRTPSLDGASAWEQWVLGAAYRVGWLTIAALLAWALLGADARQRVIVVALCVAAAAANEGFVHVPRRVWSEPARRRRLIDVWSAGLVVFVAVLVLAAGVQFAFFAFLTVPLIALANSGWRRIAWCSLAVGVCAASMLIAAAPVSVMAVRLPLVLADMAVVLALAQAFQREAREARLRRELTAEAHHRVKNSLQGVADLLYLARGEHDGDGRLDRAASRIRSIAIVHELLARDGEDGVAVDELLQRVAAGLDRDIHVQVQPLALPLERAQQVGIVANELLTNAAKHGRAPITLTLDDGEVVRLAVHDAGGAPGGPSSGVGLTLVRHFVEYGLDGTLELVDDARGTHARVDFPRTPCAS